MKKIHHREEEKAGRKTDDKNVVNSVLRPKVLGIRSDKDPQNNVLPLFRKDCVCYGAGGWWYQQSGQFLLPTMVARVRLDGIKHLGGALKMT